MARPLRLEFAGAHYHVLARGNGRQAIFRGDADCKRFLELLDVSSERFAVEVHAFVLMGNHFHLLVRTRRANLSRWMQWLLGSYTAYFQRRHRRVGYGHLFQGRFKSHLIEADNYLLTLSRYLHLNPVRGAVIGRGTLAERREQLRAFAWSGYAGYAGLRAQFPFVREELILGDMARSLPRRSSLAAGRQAYRRFVEAGLTETLGNPLDEAVAQSVLGSETFIQKLADGLADFADGPKERTAERHLRRRAGRTERISAEDLIATVARAYGKEPAELIDASSKGRWSEARGVAMMMLRAKTELSLRDIGDLFGGVSYQAVAQRIRRTTQRARKGQLQMPLAQLEAKLSKI